MRSSVLFIISIGFFLILSACQKAVNTETLTAKSATDVNGYNYEYVENDPSKTRIYTLDNGLKVYLSVYKEEPRIMTYIPVKAGGKFDPANSTGLAHYLEHIMFKGTDKFGTKNWEEEKKLLDQIEQLFEEYRGITDPEERKKHYAKIDKISNEASKFAIANEYDKMTSLLGYTGTNAYTSPDRTVYVNNIPANQLENFLDIESDRFGIIVNRLFHTELETVYEEKNRGLDNDYRKTYEAMNKNMFTKHPYGTQTVIGTIEHLKNPSIKDINEYFYKYYVPNNMAICMSGDLDPDKTIKLIDEYFGKLKAKPLADYVAVEEPALTENKEVTVLGPDKERVNLGFRMGGSSDKEFHKMQLIDFMLANSTAGLIDLNLVQQQKVLSASCYVNDMNDYSIHTFYGEPREGQTMEEVRDLLLGQIDIIKQGKFEDWLVKAVINDWKKIKMEGLESNYSRANDMVMAFTNNMSWLEYISIIEKMETLTKEDIVKFANENYNNYVAVYKKTGEDPNKQKVEKPSITPVEVDRIAQSDFFKRIKAREVNPIAPVFVDYDKDITKTKMKSDVPVLYKENTENELFTMYYLLETGTNENPKVKLALDYLEYLGTETLSPKDFKKELYKLGCNFGINSSTERIYVYLSGLSENMVPAMKLFEDLLENPKADEKVLQNLIADAHKSRADAKKEKWRILWQGLANYAKYGANSPYTNVLSNEELNRLQSNELISIIKSIPQMQHKILYYGPMQETKLIATLNDLHRVPAEMKALPSKKVFATQDMDDPNVYFANYDMVQAEMMLTSKQDQFDKEILPEVNVFNEYFGSGMSSVLFQEIREARGLAYSVFSRYNIANKAEDNDYLTAYLGTQADKQEEALDALVDLLNNLPESEKNFENAKKSILSKIESSRITKTSVFFNYLAAQRKNLDYDVRKDVYTRINKMTFDDLKNFHGKYVKDKKFNIAIVGDKDKVNFRALSKYGKVNKLSLDEVFGYEDYKEQVKG
jgi:predicted Zn-dependent peptidase